MSRGTRRTSGACRVDDVVETTRLRPRATPFSSPLESCAPPAGLHHKATSPAGCPCTCLATSLTEHPMMKISTRDAADRCRSNGDWFPFCCATKPTRDVLGALACAAGAQRAAGKERQDHALPMLPAAATAAAPPPPASRAPAPVVAAVAAGFLLLHHLLFPHVRSCSRPEPRAWRRCIWRGFRCLELGWRSQRSTSSAGAARPDSDSGDEGSESEAGPWIAVGRGGRRRRRRSWLERWYWIVESLFRIRRLQRIWGLLGQFLQMKKK